MSAHPWFTRRPDRHQRGVGMIELMISMALGAVVVIGVIQMFTANRQTFRMQDSTAITQETGTFVIDFLTGEFQRAGFGGASSALNVAFDWANTADGGVGGNDRVAVVYDPRAASNLFCTGEDVGAATRISNRYWVDNGQLFCQGAVDNGLGAFVAVGTPQVLADNVESFQVLFGVDTDHAGCPAGAGEPTAYVRANLVLAAVARGQLACPVTNPPTAQFASTVVRTVRVGLLLRTPTTVDAVTPASRTYPVLDELVGSPAIAPDDGFVRRFFVRTTLIRNSQRVL